MSREEDAPHITHPPKAIMDDLMEFMADILDLQNDLKDEKYKKLAERAESLYKAAIEYRQEKANAHAKEKRRFEAMTAIAVDALVCKIVRDEPWEGLTPTVLRNKLARSFGVGVSPSSIDLQAVKETMDREVKLLVAAGRSDPAGGSKKRRKL